MLTTYFAAIAAFIRRLTPEAIETAIWLVSGIVGVWYAQKFHTSVRINIHIAERMGDMEAVQAYLQRDLNAAKFAIIVCVIETLVVVLVVVPGIQPMTLMLFDRGLLILMNWLITAALIKVVSDGKRAERTAQEGLDAKTATTTTTTPTDTTSEHTTAK